MFALYLPRQVKARPTSSEGSSAELLTSVRIRQFPQVMESATSELPEEPAVALVDNNTWRSATAADNRLPLVLFASAVGVCGRGAECGPLEWIYSRVPEKTDFT